jgi:hypothetical protein
MWVYLLILIALSACRVLAIDKKAAPNTIPEKTADTKIAIIAF